MKSRQQNNYTIRVYAIITNTENEVLLMNETYRGITFTKFPGGGLEWGEGILDCIKRELSEELSLHNLPLAQFYITDFFQESFFDVQTQVVSVYYKTTQAVDKHSIQCSKEDEHLLGIHWVPMDVFGAHHLTFPIDKHVAKMLGE
jgi:ADP-ribose pyrophosphatase YjhB (NUDIX family)